MLVLGKKLSRVRARYQYSEHSSFGVDLRIGAFIICRYGPDGWETRRKAIFGGGLLLSEKAAAERAAAEKAAAHKWELSDRELAIVASLD